MPIRALTLALAVVLAFALPGVATAQTLAQTPTVPQDGSGLSTTPPAGLGSGSSGSGGSSSGNGSSSGTKATGTDKLPRTGEDAGLMLFAGLSLVLVGVGLRLRTADADLF